MKNILEKVTIPSNTRTATMSSQKPKTNDSNSEWGILNQNFKDLKEESIKPPADNGEVWVDDFNENVKKYFGEMSKETMNKAKDLKVKLCSLDRKFLQAKLDETEENQVLNFKINFLAKLTSRVQCLAEVHGHAFDFIRELFNKFQERIEKVEAKADKAEQKASALKDDMKGQVEDASGPLVERMIVDKTENLTSLIDTLKAELDIVKEENEKLSSEVDEARQRERKGNIILASPHKPERNQHTLLKPKTLPDGSGIETSTQMCRRLIKEKTGVDIKESDVMACHRLKDENTFILAISNRVEGSGWETLSAGMVTGKKEPNRGRDSPNFEVNNLFLNFQLTSKRGAIVKAASVLRKAGEIFKYSVNQNGRITVVHKKPPQGDRYKWEEVRSMSDLAKMVGHDIALPNWKNNQRTNSHLGARHRQ